MNAKQEKLFITIPLGTTAHDYARQFAKLQVNEEKATQVYRQILTIYAVHCYLQYLDIESDLSQSEGWNLAIATLQKAHGIALGNSASLHLPKFGDLECQLVQPGDKSIDLQDHAKEDKIGILVLRYIDIEVTKIEEMEVIGFVSDLNQLPIAIDQLPPTGELLDRLELLQLLTPVRIYVPDLSIEQVKVELEKIHQESDDLRFEYEIVKFLKSGRERTKQRLNDELIQLLQSEMQNLAFARERASNPDRELQALAAKLAEQLQDLWGRLK
jgi:Protein of unknown function (DUF1822)